MIIGFTVGVFDLLHSGHINILRKAKEHCDRLYVGLATDMHCLRRKGRYPVCIYDERKIVLEGLRFVDAVLPQEFLTDETLASYMTRVKKDISFTRLFKGDDVKGSHEWNEVEEVMKNQDVTVEYFAYTKNISSTYIRARCNTDLGKIII